MCRPQTIGIVVGERHIMPRQSRERCSTCLPGNMPVLLAVCSHSQYARLPPLGQRRI